MSYKEMTKEELQEIRKEVAAKYDELTLPIMYLLH